MRESTEATRNRILEAARQEMLRVGYPGASMRKIAADAGVTAGALYKHFRGKEEIFETICDGVIGQLFAKQKSLLPDGLEQKTDAELLALFEQDASVQMLAEFWACFPLLQMIVLHGNPDYYARKRAEYLAFSASYATRYYEELYRRGLAKRRYSYSEVYLLSQAEFLALCSFLEREGGGIGEAEVQAYKTLLRIVRLGIRRDAGLGQE